MTVKDGVDGIPRNMILIGFAAYFGVIMTDVFFSDGFGFGLFPILILAVFLLVFGAVFSMMARFNLKRSYHFLPRANELVKGGLYRWFRHPVYMGNLTFLFGFALLYGSIVGLILTVIILIPVHLVRARYEERILIRTFKDDYVRYKAQTIF